MASFVVIGLGLSLPLLLLGVRLPSARYLVPLTSFSAFRATIFVAIGVDFFPGVASVDPESDPLLLDRF